jgi:hypothetical protein
MPPHNLVLIYWRVFARVDGSIQRRGGWRRMDSRRVRLVATHLRNRGSGGWSGSGSRPETQRVGAIRSGGGAGGDYSWRRGCAADADGDQLAAEYFATLCDAGEGGLRYDDALTLWLRRGRNVGALLTGRYSRNKS